MMQETIKAALLAKCIEDALALIVQYGSIEGDHHKQWVLDQVVRTLLDHNDAAYRKWVELFNDGEGGPETYRWDTGVEP